MVKSVERLENIYISLDCLLDTRLSTLGLINESIVSDILENKYHERDEDRFTGIDDNVFKELYSARNTETLKYARPTGMLALLKSITDDLVEQTIVRPFASEVTVTVNIFPYILSHEEKEMLIKAIVVSSSLNVRVELIDLPLIELTPEVCKERFSLIIMYTEYAEWLEMHVLAFTKTTLSDITLLAPALYMVQKPTEEVITELMKDISHPFAATERAMSTIIKLVLTDIKYYSIIKT